MGHGVHLKLAPLALALALALALVLPTSHAEATCSAREIDAPGAQAYDVRGCEGSMFLGASATLPGARVEAQWERDEPAGYTSLGVSMPPRYVSWHEDEHGCRLDVGLAGAMHEACPMSPPAPVVP